MRLGIDLGGTKTEAAVIDDDGVIIWRERTDTQRRQYRDIISTISSLIDAAEQATSFAGPVGIGIPGRVVPTTGLVGGANLTLMNGKPFEHDLKAATGRLIRLSNDANCFALSEARDGAAAGFKTVLGVILGTGCGSGLVVNGKILTGANGIAGEIGHTPLPWPLDFEYDGHDCWCGNTGCLETFVSGTALAADYESRSGIALTAKEIAERTHIDLVAESVLQVYEDRLGRALAQAINIVDPEAIVLGGGMSNLDRLYQNVPRKWKNRVFGDAVSTQLFKPKFGDSSGVRGAAWLWEKDEVGKSDDGNR